MQMIDTISLKGIFVLQDASDDHIEKINQIHAQHGSDSGDFASCNDRKGRDHKSEKHRPRISSPYPRLEWEPKMESDSRDEYSE